MSELIQEEGRRGGRRNFNINWDNRSLFVLATFSFNFGARLTPAVLSSNPRQDFSSSLSNNRKSPHNVLNALLILFFSSLSFNRIRYNQSSNHVANLFRQIRIEIIIECNSFSVQCWMIQYLFFLNISLIENIFNVDTIE